MLKHHYKAPFLVSALMILMMAAIIVLPGVVNQRSISGAHAANGADGKIIQVQVNVTADPLHLSGVKSVEFYSSVYELATPVSTTENTNHGCFNITGTYTNLTNATGDGIQYSSEYTRVAFDFNTGVCPEPRNTCNLDLTACSGVSNATGTPLGEYDFTQPTFIGSSVDRFTVPYIV